MPIEHVLEELKRLENAERLQVIEAAARLVRDELRDGPTELDRRLRMAAFAVKDLYEPGSGMAR